MREELKDPGRLEHILTAIDYVIEFSSGKTINDLSEHEPLFYALVKNIETIGEASYMLSMSFKESHPETDWRKIINMRHILVHGYFDISKERLWDVIQNDIRPLRKQIVRYLEEAS